MNQNKDMFMKVIMNLKKKDNKKEIKLIMKMMINNTIIKVKKRKKIQVILNMKKLILLNKLDIFIKKIIIE